jgi:hypothetical protein
LEVGEELGAGVALEAEVVVAAGGVLAEVLGVEAGVDVVGFGVTGLGASTPAVPEPRPNFCRLGASIFPLLLRPLSDWNFCMAEMVLESHLPLGLPW